MKVKDDWTKDIKDYQSLLDAKRLLALEMDRQKNDIKGEVRRIKQYYTIRKMLRNLVKWRNKKTKKSIGDKSKNMLAKVWQLLKQRYFQNY